NWTLIAGFLILEFLNFEQAFCQTTMPTEAKVFKALVDCDNPPNIICAHDFHGCPGGPEDPNATGYAKASPGGPNCSTPLVSFSDRTISTGPCAGQKTIQRIWVAEDPEKPNLRNFCIQYLYFQDSIAPVFTHCPKDTVVNSNEHCVALVRWESPFVSDACGKVCVESSLASGSSFTEGKHIVTYTATDACGNKSTCSFSITVVATCCTAPPVIHCPNDFNGCPQGTEPGITGNATASPGSPFCATPILTFRDSIIEASGCTLKLIRIWTATDPDHPFLTTTCLQKIAQSDTQKPSITCPPNLTLQSDPDCKAVATWVDPVVSDNCSNTTLAGSHVSGNRFNSGITTVTYTATDDCGNSASCSFTITVIANCCNNNPIIVCPSDFNGCPQGIEPAITGTAIGKPFQPGCPDPVISFTDQILYQQGCSLRVMRTWIAQDPTNSNLSASCNQVIDLHDIESPNIICPAHITVASNLNCKAIVQWNEPATSDNCSRVTLSGSLISGSEFSIGTTSVAYTASDACGNTATCRFNITVEDSCCNNNPIIICPPDFNGCPQGIEPAITGNAIGKPYRVGCPEPVISFTDLITYQQGCSLRVVRTWLAQDPTNINLSTSCDQVIDLHDNESPNIICPANITVQSNLNCKAIVQWSEPTTSDNCSRVNLTSSILSGSELNLGNTDVIYTATDACGNSATCQFTVTVEENCCNQNPTIVCPPDFFGCPQGIEPAITGSATSTRLNPNCQPAIITFKDEIMYQQGCSLRVERTWTAADSIHPNLLASCVQTIDLKDIESPNIICPANITAQPDLQCNAIVSWNNPGTSDNCSRVTLNSTHVNGGIFTVGITDVIYTATDACGNSATCTFRVTVTDDCCNKRPIIVCPRDYNGCPQSTDPSNTGIATGRAAKVGCPDPIISYTDEIIYQQPCSLRLARTWRATDPNDA
ncbi:MAG TPA: HYR domain-containing protein, partial [Saprospiraceae bacterium]|nr:HYR domain-containing protein [Saprospiraceae bacterium]